jgi:2-oxoglutarate dehydrogenase complex dehydrogenase (E1) component-like enzyme
MTEDSIRVTAGRPTSTGDDRVGGGGRRLPVPSELIVLVATVLAILIAAAAADNFDSPIAWGFVTVLAFAYILSRGLAKRGNVSDDGF